MIAKFRNKNLEFGKKTHIMGILNLTPDSFSDGGSYKNIDQALKKVRFMLDCGAAIIDVGGESTRPGYERISDEEEISRIIPVMEAILAETDAIVSVDTYKPQVAKAALDAGAHMINDIWGFKQEGMAELCAEYGAFAILMHNEDEIDPERDILDAMLASLKKSVSIAKKAGVKDELICLDPGIGFGRTLEQNLQTLRNLHLIKELGYPVLLGASRKSVIGKTCNLDVNERLEGTIVANTVGVSMGVDIVRVHDVLENRRAMMFADAIYRGKIHG